jgi:hypothetical protein
MADGGLNGGARRLNLSFSEPSWDEILRQQAEAEAELARRGFTRAAPAGPAGLNEPPPVRAPGPPVAAPLPDPIAPPGAKVRAKDVRNQFDNLTFWDRMMKTPEWQRGVEGVGEVRTAVAERAAKPDTMQRAAEAAEADAADLDKEADRLRKAGKISEAKSKSDAAYAKRQEAAESALMKARTNEVTEAQKKAKDWISNAKKKKAEVWVDRKKGAVRGGIIGGAALGAGYLGNEMMDAWQESENASAENQAANEIMNRILMGGETTPEEDALVIEKLGSEEAFLKLKANQGAAAPPVDPAPDPTAAPSRPPGPPLRDPAPGMIDVAYREGAGKPEVPGVETTYDPELHAAILASPDGGEEAATLYADQAAAEDHRRRANALTDAGVENTAAAAGMPDSVMNYLRDQGEYARAADAGEAPVSDNWWNNFIARPMQESMARSAEFNADPANRQGSPVLRAYDSLPEWAQGGLDIADSLFNPITIGQGILSTTTDEAAAMPYQLGRNTVLGPGAFTGLNDEAFGPAYREALRSMGGEALGPDPVATPIAEGAAPIYGPADMSDMGGGMGSGTGTGNAGMPGMEDLAQLEQIGALGTNPDGSNMTVAQYIQQGNLAGAGVEPALPMFGGSPDLGGMPPLPMLPGPPDLGGPAGLPIDPRLSLPSGGMPAGPPPIVEPAAPPMMGDIPPGGPGDQYASGGVFGPAYAGTMPDNQQARDDAVASVVENDEVGNPRGQTDSVSRDAIRPRARPAGLNEGAAPVVDATVPAPSAPMVEVAATPGGRPAPGAVGDFNTTRERGDAGLAEDAEAAKEELNWINRMMRDKMGMTDASDRAKAAEALVSFGSTLLASKGDSWQAIGEGLQAGLGSVTAANDEEAAALAAQQQAMIEEDRWRAEYALKDLQARRGGGDSGLGKVEDLMNTMSYLRAINPNLTEEQARQEAERILGIKSEAAWNADPNAWMAGFGQ